MSSSAIERHSTLVRGLISLGIDEPTWPEQSLSDDEFRRVLIELERHHLVPTLTQAADVAGFPLSVEQREEIAHRHRALMVNSLEVERSLLLAADVLRDQGISFRVIKGVANAHLLHDEPAWRAAGDLDMLIESSQIIAAADALRNELGGSDALPDVRPGFAGEFGKEIVVKVGSIQLDLHRTFVAGPFGLLVDNPALFTQSTSFAIGGETIPALGVSHLFVHGCFSLALGDNPVRLGAARDLLLINHRYELDWREIHAIAADWKCGAVLRAAGDIVADVAPDHSRLATQLRSSPSSRLQGTMIRSHTATGYTYRRQLASLLVLPGLRPRLRYARALAFPSAEYLKSRGWSQAAHLSRSARKLAGRSR